MRVGFRALHNHVHVRLVPEIGSFRCGLTSSIRHRNRAACRPSGWGGDRSGWGPIGRPKFSVWARNHATPLMNLDNYPLPRSRFTLPPLCSGPRFEIPGLTQKPFAGPSCLNVVSRELWCGNLHWARGRGVLMWKEGLYRSHVACSLSRGTGSRRGYMKKQRARAHLFKKTGIAGGTRHHHRWHRNNQRRQRVWGKFHPRIQLGRSFSCLSPFPPGPG